MFVLSSLEIHFFYISLAGTTLPHYLSQAFLIPLEHLQIIL